MDRLYEQMRARYSNSDRKELERNNTREGQAQAAQPKKAVSFKEGKKVKWFQGPLSGQTSQVDELSDGEFATAIAAAAYAINSLGEGSPNKKMPVDGLHTTFTKTKSKKENSDLNITNSGRISRWFSGKKAKEDGASVGETSMRKSEARDSKALEDPTVNLAKSGKGMGTVPSIKKTPTFSDKYLHGTGSKRFPGEEEKITGQNASATGRTPTSRIGSGKSNLINSGHTDTKADAWEKAQMAKIKRRGNSK
uniref:Defensin-like protein 1 n=1 Tax=Anthurium amnicola TaxID=1678845 RepID=A0A1D1XJI9_9ARAE